MRARLGTRRALCAVATALLAAAAPSRAQVSPLSPLQTPPTPRAYLSVGAGAAAHAIDCAGSRECDRVGSATRAALGVFLTPAVAVEVAAADFGKSRIGDRLGDAEFGVRMVGVGIAVPLEYGARFNGLLRLGVASVRATLQPLPAGTTPPLRGTSVEGYYGFTVGVMLAPQLAGELSFDGTRGYAGSTGGRVDALTLGLSLRF